MVLRTIGICLRDKQVVREVDAGTKVLPMVAECAGFEVILITDKNTPLSLCAVVEDMQILLLLCTLLHVVFPNSVWDAG